MKKEKFFKINLLSANKNYNLICHQIQKYKPSFFLIFDKKIFEKVKKNLKKNIKIINSLDEKHLIKKRTLLYLRLLELQDLNHNSLLYKKSKKILIANKESIVCGWELIKSYLKKFKTKLISIDSEHYSIMKLMEGYKLNEIKNI